MKEKKSILQRIAIFAITTVLVLGAIYITVNRDVMNFDAFRRWLVYGDLELTFYGESATFAHGGGDMATFALADQGAVMVSQAGSRYYSFKGDIFVERVLSYSNPVLHTGNQNSVLYDAGGKSLSIYGNQEEKFAMGLGQDDSIISARLNKNDWLTVVTQGSGYKGVVTVYNTQNQVVMDISLSTTYVTDAFLSPDNRSVAVVTVGQTGGEFVSNLLIYPVDQNNTTVQKDLSFFGEVILDMDYESDRIWLLCEKSLIIIDASTFEQTVWSFSGRYLKDSNLEGDGFATLLLGQYRAGTADTLLTVGKDAEVMGEIPLSSSPLALSSAGRYIAYLTGERFTVYTPDLQEYAALEEVRHATEVALSTDGTVLLASSQEAWLFLPN